MIFSSLFLTMYSNKFFLETYRNMEPLNEIDPQEVINLKRDQFPIHMIQ